MVAVIVILIDIAIAFTFLFSLISLKMFQRITLVELEQSVVTAISFSVVIK